MPRYRIADYLSWRGDWELWEGQAVSMTPSPGFVHQQTALRLTVALDRALRAQAGCGDCHLVYEIDWQIDDTTVVRPDVLIVCGDPPAEFVKSPPSFIAEILSPSTRDKDRIHKRALYESRSVRHYLLIDPESRSREFLTLDSEGVYQTTDDVTLDLHANCKITLDLSDVTR